ncbi:MAG: YitT family protein [Anaerovoracaceae bacterium]|jgi:uncharacterized membrane-anchored protein YitT (DUF2179 family)
MNLKNIFKAKPKVYYIMVDYFLLLLGTFFTSLSFNFLLFPNQIAAGGVTGISILIESLTGIEPAYTQWGLNIPLFVLGIIIVGKGFGFRTAFGSVILPLFILLTGILASLLSLAPLTSDPILAAIFGGVGVGLGEGLCFRGKGSTGGLSILAKIIHLRSGISLGNSALVLDALVILGASFVFGPEKALYALLSVYITSKAIDIVQIGFHFSKIALIISDKHTDIRTAVLSDMERGATRLEGYGGFTQDRKDVLLVVVSQNEVNKLKEILKRIDPHAFVMMWDSYEVLGLGFHFHPNLSDTTDLDTTTHNSQGLDNEP